MLPFVSSVTPSRVCELKLWKRSRLTGSSPVTPSRVCELKSAKKSKKSNDDVTPSRVCELKPSGSPVYKVVDRHTLTDV